MNYNLKHERPPKELYDRISKVFGDRFEEGIIYTYKDTIYAKFNLSEDLIVHELVHIKQQTKDANAWWDRYLIDPEFRLSQEVEAYKKQYRWAKANYRNRELVARLLHKCSKDLSSSIYGDLVTFNTALTLIKN